jgi:hypothetical protein
MNTYRLPPPSDAPSPACVRAHEMLVSYGPARRRKPPPGLGIKLDQPHLVASLFRVCVPSPPHEVAVAFFLGRTSASVDGRWWGSEASPTSTSTRPPCCAGPC